MEINLSVAEVVGILILILGVGTAVHKISKWSGSVDTDRTNFREFMQKIEDKIEQIFLRLPPPKTVNSRSPLRLNPLGEHIWAELNASEWIDTFADTVHESVKDKEAYEIQEYSFEYVDNNNHYSEDQLRIIRRLAYENGLSDFDVRRVVGIKLRDRLLDSVGMEAPQSGN